MKRIFAAVNGLMNMPAKARRAKEPADQFMRILKSPSLVLTLVLRPRETRGIHPGKWTTSRWTVMFKEKASICDRDP